ERQRIARAYRSLGEGRKEQILGELEREKDSILSQAFAEAEDIRGQADAIAARTYSDAYSQDAGFFEFWRAVESYRDTLPRFRKTLTTDLEYFDFLYSESGQ
ncbi:MAG: protease modulator HflC, partial [Spirochaetota bacterium]